MLSYRHAFHAGNYADVLKHLVLVKTIEYLTLKPSPIMYIDTHAGAGIYQLDSAMSAKTAEHEAGVERLDFNQLPGAENYSTIVNNHLVNQQYLGSPCIAAQLLRQQDKLRLYELHNSDFPLLETCFQKDPRSIVSHTDGYKGLSTILPLRQMRALILIDPAYEIKSEYSQVVEAIKQAYKSMSNAVVMLWYPVVQRERIEKLLESLCTGDIRDIWQFEIAISPDTERHGMTASGMLVINPPWVLPDQMRQLLPILSQQLSASHGSYLVKQLVVE